MSKYVAKVTYKAEVEVEFDSNETGWKHLQHAAVMAAMDQGLLPEEWLSIEWPLVESLD